jgi:hypothetical protein
MVKIDVSENGLRIVKLNQNNLVDIQNLISGSFDSVSFREIIYEVELSRFPSYPICVFFDSNLEDWHLERVCSLLRDCLSIKLVDSYLSKEFDFSKIVGLEELDLNWAKGYKNFGSDKLRKLVLRKCNKSRLSFNSTKKLIVLELIQGSVDSLNGIEVLTDLKALTLFKLKGFNSENIKHLYKLENLEYLFISSFDQRLDLSEICNTLKSLKWVILENCSNLHIEDLQLNKNTPAFKIIKKTNLSNSEVAMLNEYKHCKYDYLYPLNDSVVNRVTGQV